MITQGNKRAYFFVASILCIIMAWYIPRWAFETIKGTVKKGAVYIDNAHYDFGTVAPGEIVKHKYLLTNSTLRNIQIENLKTSCSCMVADITNHNLASGESLEIPVQFDTNGQYGPVSKKLAVITKDPDYKIIDLSISGDVLYMFSPPSKKLQFTFRREHASLEKFIISTAGPAKDALLNIRQETVPDFLNITLKRTASNIHVSASLDSENSPDKFSGTVFLDPSDDELPSYPIHYYGQLKGDFSYLPQKLYLGIVKPGDSIQRHLTIWANNEALVDSIKFALGRKTSKFFDVELKFEKQGTIKWDLEFSFQVKDDIKGGSKIADFINLENSGQDELNIFVEGYVAP